ncbi:MAG: DUF2213 domain-containing protein [Rhodospirillales bacterium]|nr:DUF2213 domain-containing protein [Rhodospirillales bacterium]
MTEATAAGVLFRAPETGRVLLVLRNADSDHGGTWSIPAGHIEAGETPEQAARRECIEEANHAPEAMTLGGQSGSFVWFEAEEPEFVPILNSESDGYMWASPDALPSPMHPGATEMIQGTRQAQDRREYDANGWFSIPDNPISKVGVFPYLGSSLDMPNVEPGRLYGVLRPAEELSRPETLESFKLLPWIDEHAMLGPEEAGMQPAERKGVQGIIGEQVYFDGTYVRGNIKCLSEAMTGLIVNGKRELSCGYRCRYEHAPGVWEGIPYEFVQREIRGNHLALVDAGRMGPDVAVQDAREASTEQGGPMADESKEEKGGESKGYTLEEAMKHLDAIVPMVKELHAKVMGEAAPGGEEEVTDTDETKPGKEDPKPAEEAKEQKGMDAAAIARAVRTDLADHSALYQRISAHVGAFDHADMSVAQLVEYGAKKLNLNRTDRAYLEGRLDAMSTTPAQDAAPRATGSVMQRVFEGS